VGFCELPGGCDGLSAVGSATGSEQNLTEDHFSIGAIRRLLDGGLCEIERFWSNGRPPQWR